jgi:isopenicillin N synthase-like dioxygenase
MLIKHRDDWAGTADITRDEPQSVNGGDFADVLAAHGDNPWPDEAPAKGGATGDLFRAIIRTAFAPSARR